MSNQFPLQGEYVIFTGLPRSSEATNLTKQFGGHAIIAPLITTKEIVSQEDEKKLLESKKYDWFIFTSQSSVHAFQSKMNRFHKAASFFQAKIAAVGSQTAAALEKIGFSVDFIPSTFSADVFVKEFPAHSSEAERCFFFRGNLAKETITNGLVNQVDIWTIYETVEVDENKERIRKLIESDTNCSIIFTSPSTAEVFHLSIGIYTGYNSFTVCTIGHITKEYLESLGVTVHVMPETYTLTAIINKLAKWKGREL